MTRLNHLDFAFTAHSPALLTCTCPLCHLQFGPSPSSDIASLELLTVHVVLPWAKATLPKVADH